MGQAFEAVLDAEKTGANVTDLMVRLNYAVGILAQADNSYRIGYSSKAAAQADKVLLISQQVINEAQNDKQTAIVSNQNSFWSTIILTVIVVFVFLLILILVWLRFKRSYINRV